MYMSKEILIFFCGDFVINDLRNDVIIVHPFKTDPRIFGVWYKYFDATFLIAACILMLTALVINVTHRYQRTRDRVGVQTIDCHDSSDVPRDTEECYISLCNFVVGYQLESP